VKEIKFYILIISIISLIASIGLANDKKTAVTSIPHQTSMQEYALGYYESDPTPYKIAYLTFDDGPTDWTAGILDILKKEKVPATFFVCGAWGDEKNLSHNRFRKYRDVLIRMVREGHIIGNHTLNHQNLAKLPPENIAKEIDDNQILFNQELKEYAQPMTLIRPPYGSPFIGPSSKDVREKVGKILRKKGLVMLWSKHFDSSDSMEWVRGEWYEEGPRVNIKDEEFKEKMHRIYVRLISRANGNGIVILFHDTHPTSMDILSKVIEKLKSEGYRFGTLEDYVKWRWHKSSSDLVAEQN
jgi:peptidoglycan-N-acetylglucosamine deacetylase